jgi:hypothetical protein
LSTCPYGTTAISLRSRIIAVSLRRHQSHFSNTNFTFQTASKIQTKVTEIQTWAAKSEGVANKIAAPEAEGKALASRL